MGSERTRASRPLMIGVLAGAVLTVIVAGAFLYIQQLHHEIAETKTELVSTKENLVSAQAEKNQIVEEKKVADQLLEVTTEGLNQANTELAKKPDLPVSISYRQAMMGSGLVSQFTNNSDRFLSIVATFQNPTTNQHTILRLDLTPNVTKEIGHMEGWTFSSGDQITMQNNDYEPITMTVR